MSKRRKQVTGKETKTANRKKKRSTTKEMNMKTTIKYIFGYRLTRFQDGGVGVTVVQPFYMVTKTIKMF